MSGDAPRASPTAPASVASPYWPGVARVWHRVWTLYLVHLLTDGLGAWHRGRRGALASVRPSPISVNEIDKLFERAARVS